MCAFIIIIYGLHSYLWKQIWKEGNKEFTVPVITSLVKKCKLSLHPVGDVINDFNTHGDNSKSQITDIWTLQKIVTPCEKWGNK